MAFLTAKTLGFGNGDSRYANFVQRFFHLIKFERLDDCLDLFHFILSYPYAPATTALARGCSTKVGRICPLQYKYHAKSGLCKESHINCYSQIQTVAMPLKKQAIADSGA